MSFVLTSKQKEALEVINSASTHVLLYGGSRSGKTFLLVRAIVIRAMAAAESSHVILRYRFNQAKTKIGLGTFPKVMSLCFPDISYGIDKTDWYFTLPNLSVIWLGGLDEKERTEKILGEEHATIYLNECSQIPYSSRNLALTRLAQKTSYTYNGQANDLRLKMYYDENPPTRGHWSYKLFFEHTEPNSKNLLDKSLFAKMQMNPADNLVNLADNYIETLNQLPERQKKRFLHGEFSEISDDYLWTLEGIETWRALKNVPDMQRIVVAVDPSGADSDSDEEKSDAIGIVVAGLGTDGNGYLLEDLTLKASPKIWGEVATQAYDRHKADAIVAEGNYGGAMVEHVIQTARPRTPYKKVTATRGKVVRAEPIAALAEKGSIRHAGYFNDLEDELCDFTPRGYLGERSPNRADAYVWAFTELFDRIVAKPNKNKSASRKQYSNCATSWMGL
jgi:phage terminase large subunit-like protein